MSGKIRIQKRPVLPTERERTFLADSIWLERIRAEPSAFNPYEPKATESPRVATETLKGFLLIVCHFLYLTFFGKSIIGLFSATRTGGSAYFGGEDIALIYPDLNPDSAVRNHCFGQCIINIGAQSLERDAAEFAIFRPTHGGTTQTTSQKDAHPEHIAVGHGLLEHLLHHTPERQTFLKTLHDHLCHYGSIGLG